jgi:hypothetical protein
MKAKHLLNERKELMKTAGLLSENRYFTSINDMDDVLHLLDRLYSYMHDRADSVDGGGMNKEASFLSSIEEAEEFLKNLQA